MNLAFLHLRLSFPVLSPNHTPSPRISICCFHSGISRAGLWIHPEGRVNSLPCRVQDTVKDGLVHPLDPESF